ncbi:MAG: sugar MFS transporter [Verrucomicrobiota bacterium]|jgi:FHS family L-fucose permease-like MFS transporter
MKTSADDPTGFSGGATLPATAGAGKTYRKPFAIMTVLFFMWGFMTVWNDILIPRFKDAFTLNYFQAMLVQFAWGGAYTVGALVYYVIAMFSGDPINRIGYKNGVIIGLLFAAAGSALFFPAAILTSYPFFLVALFIVGLGFAMLQIACNPYVTILGPEPTAPSRLNLSQSFNSFGTTIGPIIGGWLIFTVFTRPGAHGADSVKVPYLCFAAVFLLLAVGFKFAHLPEFANKDHISRGVGPLKYPHTVLGMIAIFMYVGGEVGVGSVIINYLALPKLGGLSHETASKFLAFYWGGLMIGRFMGAFALSEMRQWVKHSLVVLTPLAAFCFILALPNVAEALHLSWASAAAEVCSTANALHYGALLAVLLFAFFLGEASAHRMLALFSAVIIGLLLAGILGSGQLAVWSILGVGLFCSVMWSNIFSLAIEGLGPLKSQGSSLLIMAILGVALLPPLQGFVADRMGIQFSFIVPMGCFVYIAFYGLYGYRAGRQKNAATANGRTDDAAAAAPKKDLR